MTRFISHHSHLNFFLETPQDTVEGVILMVVWCVCGGGSGGGGGRGGGVVKLMNVNSGFSKISFDSKSFVVIMCLILISKVF